MSVEDIVDHVSGKIDEIEEPVSNLEVDDIKTDDFQDIFTEFKMIDRYIASVQNNLDKLAEEVDNPFEMYENLVQRFDGVNEKFEEVVQQFKQNQMGGMAGGAGGPGGGDGNNIVDLAGN